MTLRGGKVTLIGVQCYANLGLQSDPITHYSLTITGWVPRGGVLQGGGVFLVVVH